MKKFFEKLKSLDKGTIIRTIMLVLSVANQIVAIIGSFSFAKDAAWYQILSVIVTALVAAVTYWYNNNWTKAAQLGEDIIAMIKDGKITNEEAEQFIRDHLVSEEEKVINEVETQAKPKKKR